MSQPASTATSHGPRSRRIRAVVIGASSGGFEALKRVLGGLAAEFPAPVMIVLHRMVSRTDGFVPLLQPVCKRPVKEAEPGEPLQDGVIYLAPAGYHLLVERNYHLSLSMDPKVCHVRPAADVLFASAADAFRAQLVGVILTGANEDGAAGLTAVRAAGGLALVQDPGEAEAPQMPRAAIERAGADSVLRLAEIAPMLNQLAGCA